MAYDQKDMSGALFRNDKGTNEKRPDYRGDCKIGGVTYKISAWIKAKQDGDKFMSLAFESKEPAAVQPGPAPAASGDAKEDLPF
jgi:uncharacterized protein (DUF736 family)